MSTAAGGPRVTIPNGQTVSNAIDLGEQVIVGIQMPSGFTGTSLTFQASADAITYVAVTDKAAAAYTVTVSASKYIVISPYDLAGVRFVKFVSQAAEGADRIIQVVTRSIE